MSTATQATIATGTSVAEHLIEQGASTEGACYAAAQGLVERMADERPDLLVQLFLENVAR